jgi:hypothetical protein
MASDSEPAPDERPPRRLRAFSPDDGVNPPGSPILMLFVGCITVPMFFAIAHHAEVLAVVGLVFIQVAALLLAPKEVFTDGFIRRAEERWQRSRVARFQRSLGEVGRRVLRYAAIASFVIALAAGPLIGLAVLIHGGVVGWIAAVATIWSFIPGPLLMFMAAAMSDRFVSASVKRRRVTDPAITVSAMFEQMHSDAMLPRTMLTALALFWLGTILAVLSTAEGNWPF